jgi:hypothetical protein
MDSLPLEHFIDSEVVMNVCVPSAGHYSLFNRSRGRASVERSASSGPGDPMLGNSVLYGIPIQLWKPHSAPGEAERRARTETPNKGLSLYFPFGYIYW